MRLIDADELITFTYEGISFVPKEFIDDAPTVGEMKPEEFAEQMRECQKVKGDEEIRHIYADALMCELLTSLGYGGGIKVFKEMPKWYA